MSDTQNLTHLWKVSNQTLKKLWYLQIISWGWKVIIFTIFYYVSCCSSLSSCLYTVIININWVCFLIFCLLSLWILSATSCSSSRGADLWKPLRVLNRLLYSQSSPPPSYQRPPPISCHPFPLLCFKDFKTSFFTVTE